MGDLRTILDDALDRIKAEVFGNRGRRPGRTTLPDPAGRDPAGCHPRETVSTEDGHGDGRDHGAPALKPVHRRGTVG